LPSLWLLSDTGLKEVVVL